MKETQRGLKRLFEYELRAADVFQAVVVEIAGGLIQVVDLTRSISTRMWGRMQPDGHALVLSLAEPLFLLAHHST